MDKAMARLEALLDSGSLRMMDDLRPTVHILAAGAIGGRPVYCCAGVRDVAALDIHACFERKIHWLETILKAPAPVIWLHDFPPQAPGGRTPIPPRSDALLASNTAGVGRAFCLQARLNGVAPQIAALFSDCGAAQAFAVRLADFALLQRDAHIWIGRPDAVQLMLGKAPDPEKLGGAEMHCRTSGVGDGMFADDAEALDWIARCVSCLPTRAGDALPVCEGRPPARSADEMAQAIPDDLNRPFDIRPVVEGLIDAESWIGIQERYAPEALVGLARAGGVPIGVVANNSCQRGGILFPESCRKMARFIRFCDAYRIPMVFLADNPGLMVGEGAEQAGMLAEAADLLRVLAACQTPRVCLVVRKAYTVGLYAMSGPGFDPTRFWATPGASISVFGPKALDRFAADRDLPPAAVAAIREMRDHAVNPQGYADKGLLTAVLEWAQVRPELESFFQNHAKEATGNPRPH